MKCTDLEFQKIVHAKYPAKYMHYCSLYNPATSHFGEVHLLALDTMGEMQLDFKQKLKLASHAWVIRDVDGEVIKDSDGLFNTNIFTSSGPITLSLPAASTLPGGTITVKLNNPINYLPVTVKVSADGKGWELIDPEKEERKASLKCCCGAHSVGSDRHSSWCDIGDQLSTGSWRV